MPYIILLQVLKFDQPTANCFGTTRQKPVGGGGGGVGGTVSPTISLFFVKWLFKY